MMKKNSSSTTARVLSPLGTGDFFEQYWEQRPLHIGRESTAFFTDVLTKESFKKLLHEQDLYFPELQLTQSDRTLASTDYANGENKILTQQVENLHEDGATVVWAKIHESFPGIRTLCRELQSALNMSCIANAYLSPGAHQGFHAHYDSHDVFIVQVSGRKRFHFYKSGVELPFNHERFDSNWHKAGEKTEEVEIEAGDTLYIPRGVMHDAIAADDTTSLHITIGAYPTTAKDLIQHIVENAAESNADLRRSVDLNDDQSQHAKALLQHLLLTDDFSEYVECAVDDLHEKMAMASTPALLAGATVALNAGCKIRVQRQKVINTRRINDSVKLRLYGQVLEFEEPLASTVEWLINDADEMVSIAALSGLTSEQALALCKQLIQYEVAELVN